MRKAGKQTRRDIFKVAGYASAGAAAALASGSATSLAAEKKAPRWAMVMDLRRCTGVRACTVACKSEYDTPLGSWNTVVKEVAYGNYPDRKKDFLPRLCNHCEGAKDDGGPPCVKICPENVSGDRAKYVTPSGDKIRYRTGATYKRPDGVIMFDNSLCIGCGKCIDACPYGARSFNQRLTSGKDKGKNGISKCSFCAHRIDNGVEPACVNTCPNDARIFGDLNDPASEVAKLVKKHKLMEKSKETTLLADEGTLPQVFYIDPNGSVKRYSITKENKMEQFRDMIV